MTLREKVIVAALAAGITLGAGSALADTTLCNDYTPRQWSQVAARYRDVTGDAIPDRIRLYHTKLPCTDGTNFYTTLGIGNADGTFQIEQVLERYQMREYTPANAPPVDW